MTVAGSSGFALRSGEEKLPAAQARARDASRDRGGSQNRLTGDGLLWEVEHSVHRTGESDRPPWNSRARSTDLGHVPTSSTAASSTRVVARVLSFCASSRSSASSARPATITRRQPPGTTLSAADPSNGSGPNQPPMDSAGCALVPLAAGLRLRGTQARWGFCITSWGDG